MKKQKLDVPQFGPQKLEKNNKENMRNRAKKVIGGFLLGATGITGIGVAAESLERQETQHNQEMNTVFEPILKPAAEDIAKATIDKYNKSKEEKWNSSKGYAFEEKDSVDPSKYDLSVTEKDGDRTHTYTVTLGKTEKGEWDPTTVVRAEMTDMDDGYFSRTEVTAEDGDKKYWTGSTGSKSGNFTVAYNSANFGGPYDTLDDDIDSAKKIAKSVKEDLSK